MGSRTLSPREQSADTGQSVYEEIGGVDLGENGFDWYSEGAHISARYYYCSLY
jgi:hypothetical protein